MGKLHEVLAAEPERKRVAEDALKRVSHLFGRADQWFIGTLKQYEPLNEEDLPLDDQEQPIDETVPQVLSEIQEAYGPYIDVAYQKEQTNMAALADLEVGGIVLVAGIGAGALLNLENKLRELRKKVYADIPTLDPGKVWTFDEGQEVYVSRPQDTFRTKKVPRALTLAEPTKEHPAQVQTFTEDVPIGRWKTTITSGMVTSARKRQMLARIDELIAATKEARMRANTVEATNEKISKALFEYINAE